MYEGYLRVNGIIVASAAQTKAYVKNAMPRMQFKCDEVALNLLGTYYHGSMSTPSADGAQWYHSGVPETGDFYGFYPAKVEGGSDSTRAVESTELIGDGAVFAEPRRSSLETRWTLVGFAKDEVAMEAGLSWLKMVLDEPTNLSSGMACNQMTMQTIKAAPRTSAAIPGLLRYHYNVGLSVPPTVVERVRSSSGVAWTITFVLRAGIPYGFSAISDTGSIDMNSGYATFSDPAGQNCSLQNAGYADFINDPFYTAISLPPRAPVIKPPNLLPVPVWRRKSLAITSAMPASMKGTPVALRFDVLAVSALRQLRLRLYKSGQSANTCAYSGEFYISYLPAGATMIIDGALKETSVRLSGGKVVSGSHLMFGSDGNPYMWPDLEADSTYVLYADLMPPYGSFNSNISINTFVSKKD